MVAALLAASLLSACAGPATVDATIEATEPTGSIGPSTAAGSDAGSTSPSRLTSPVTSPVTSPTTLPSSSALATPLATPLANPLSTLPDTTTPTITIPVLPTPSNEGAVEGADASWPQCPKGMGIPQKRSEGAPMPLPSARFVVLGLTNGPGFHANPCLADQVAWASSRHLMTGAYSVVSRAERGQVAELGDQGPFDPSDRLGRLANVGYQQALFNVRTMQAAGLQTPAVWLDVEPVSGFDWPSDTVANAAVVRGAAKAYADEGLTVGVYSTGALWQRVVGELRLGLPEWRAAGQTSRAEALRRCGPERMFQGGTAVLTQWVQDGRDRDVTCPGGSTYLSLWFHQY
ncbi:hypothetical protein JCM18899A_36820 [Nocardioides sp. AN3]